MESRPRNITELLQEIQEKYEEEKEQRINIQQQYLLLREEFELFKQANSGQVLSTLNSNMNFMKENIFKVLPIVIAVPAMYWLIRK
jgi:hypothetical protein